MKISTCYQKFALSGRFLHCGRYKRPKVLFLLTTNFVLAEFVYRSRIQDIDSRAFARKLALPQGVRHDDSNDDTKNLDQSIANSFAIKKKKKRKEVTPNPMVLRIAYKISNLGKERIVYRWHI